MYDTVSCYTFSIVFRCPRKEFEISYYCTLRLKKTSEEFDRFIHLLGDHHIYFLVLPVQVSCLECDYCN